MVVFCKIRKKYNEIQLTKKMDLNNRKIIHPTITFEIDQLLSADDTALVAASEKKLRRLATDW